MPLRIDTDLHARTHQIGHQWSLALMDCFERKIPVTCVEFNPPVVEPHQQGSDYWLNLADPSPSELKVLRLLGKKFRYIKNNLDRGHFISITDSAARQSRIHNLSMIRLLSEAAFTQRHYQANPIRFDPTRTILHLTRNHSVAWTERFLANCKRHGYVNLLLITGDPLATKNLPGVTLERAIELTSSESESHRLKNSIELLHWTRRHHPELNLGVAHNPFRGDSALRHFDRKVDAGAQFVITQPVAYYDDSWAFMSDFAAHLSQCQRALPVVLGVFNYFVPCHARGVDESEFERRSAFWKRLFGYVPGGVQMDYKRGLDGLEILGRSIQKLKQRGFFHVDVMNAERMGHGIIEQTRRIIHEGDRLESSVRG